MFFYKQKTAYEMRISDWSSDVCSSGLSQTVAGSERRVNAAKSPHVELDRAHIAQGRARLEQRRAVIELDAARRQLAAMWGESQPAIGGQLFGEVRGDLFVLPPTGDFDELLRRLKTNPDFLRFASATRLREAELRLAATLRKPDLPLRSDERRVGKEMVSPCRSRWSPDH